MASTKLHIKNMRDAIRMLNSKIDMISALDGARNPSAMAREAFEAGICVKAIFDPLLAIQRVANGQLRRRVLQAREVVADANL